MAVSVQTASQPYAALIGLAPMMRHIFEGQDIQPVATALLERAQANPDDANALMDCATVLFLTNHHPLALSLQAQAMASQTLYQFPPKANPELRLLVIMGPGDLMANTPVEFLVEHDNIQLELLYLGLDNRWPDQVPDHDVLLIGVGESKANQELLRQLAILTEDWPRPVLNRAERIAILSRDGVCAALQNCEGIEMPLTARCPRGLVQGLADGRIALSSLLADAAFPLIVRPLGSHAGTDLDKIDTPADLQVYLQRVAAEEFYLSRFVDYRSADGQFRKYRIAIIEGKPYLCHMAISSHWMVHYLNAGMAESAEKRAEEALNMGNFDEDFGARHSAAFLRIAERLGLEYVAIDCAETADGKLLIFEADNAMIVHSLDQEDMYPYKKPAMLKVFAAFRSLLEHTCAAPVLVPEGT